jgi:NADH dehydrogenase [ubiquinone] 1 alpha subcomplex assembly factor 1
MEHECAAVAPNLICGYAAWPGQVCGGVQMTMKFTSLKRYVAALALICLSTNMKADNATNKILFDFRSATKLPAWEVVNDDVMGGLSDSQFQILTNRYAVFSGTVRLDNNGGFASVRSAPIRENLSALTAFIVRVRGDGRTYKFSVRTEAGFDSPLYQRAFKTKQGEWEEHRLELSDFAPTFRGRAIANAPPLNAATLHSVGFLISDKQAGPFRLEISWIGASPASVQP